MPRGVAKLTFRRIPLPPDARAKFDRLRVGMGPGKLGTLLHVATTTVIALDDGGMAQESTIARVVAGLEGLP